MKNIYLTGFMGSGKTSAGRLLAGKLGAPFTDTDELVRKLSGLSPREFIKKRGLKNWRKAEQAAFLCAAEPAGRVVSLGGGIMPAGKLKPVFKKTGITVYLKCGEAELLRRLAGSLKTRPLLGGSVKSAAVVVARLMKARRPFYEKADHIVDVTGLSPAGAAAKIKELLRRK